MAQVVVEKESKWKGPHITSLKSVRFMSSPTTTKTEKTQLISHHFHFLLNRTRHEQRSHTADVSQLN